MIMVRAIVRPERASEVMTALMEAGFPAVTKTSVFGRGKQRGLMVGEIHYDELPKELLMVVIPDEEKDFVLSVILKTARSGESGTFGDGKIFVSPVDEVWTVSTGEQDHLVTV